MNEVAEMTPGVWRLLRATGITPPAAWGRWSGWVKPRPDIAARCAAVVGITEADVRDIRYCWSADLIEVRAWNWRRRIVTGMELYARMLR